MCGIAGAVNYQLNIPRLKQDMLHRGPDEQDEFRSNGIHLHHHRLSIVDIACGKQPMQYEDLTLIFNGEIYNHLEIRKKFSLDCKTNSDTETILHLYKKLGADFLKEMDGMFALSIYDDTRKEVFIARDRAGKKPIYYYWNGKNFVFASELNGLRNQLDLSVNENNLHQYVRMGYFYKSATPYNDVFELPAGSYAILTTHPVELNIVKWWSIHDHYLNRSQDSLEEALQKTDDLLHLAVKRRVESSDLEVGSFLSGGIDSGIVTAIASEYNSSLKTFTVSFAGQYDEAPLAKLVANKYGTQHHEIPISFDNLVNDVERILSNYGEPFFDSSAIPSYYVSKEAKKHLTVILNGDGGDELFGGYRRYVPYARYDFFKSSGIISGAAGLLRTVLPMPNDKKAKYNFIYRLVDLAAKKGVNTYLSSTIDSFDGYEQHLTGSPNALANLEKDFKAINNSSLSGLQKIMNLDFDNILAGDLLVKMDIATMAHSLEGRSPLLSRELMEYIPGLNDKFKINGSQTKFLLRILSRKYLPAELIDQPKRGFEIPLKDWIDGQLKDLIGSYILANGAYCRQYVKPGFVEDVWNRKVRMGAEKRAKVIWTLFALEVWYRKCYKSHA